jgi:hypothetical protein
MVTLYKNYNQIDHPNGSGPVSCGTLYRILMTVLFPNGKAPGVNGFDCFLRNAINTTSCSALASAPPMTLPIAPAPNTAIFTLRSPRYVGSPG